MMREHRSRTRQQVQIGVGNVASGFECMLGLLCIKVWFARAARNGRDRSARHRTFFLVSKFAARWCWAPTSLILGFMGWCALSTARGRFKSRCDLQTTLELLEES